MRTSNTILAIAVAIAFAGGALVAWASGAQAQEPVATPRFLCRSFPGDLEKDRQVSTSDRTTEVGQWVGEREHEGWVVQSVDFEIAQKPTGYPQAWVQVCLVPA